MVISLSGLMANDGQRRTIMGADFLRFRDVVSDEYARELCRDRLFLGFFLRSCFSIVMTASASFAIAIETAANTSGSLKSMA